jgi:hypothetical protein
MTDFRDKPDAITQWRATVEALEALVQAAPEAEEIDPAEAEEVRHLIRIRVAAARSNNLPAAWVPRCEIAATAETAEGRKQTPQPPQPRLHLRPAWRE